MRYKKDDLVRLCKERDLLDDENRTKPQLVDALLQWVRPLSRALSPRGPQLTLGPSAARQQVDRDVIAGFFPSFVQLDHLEPLDADSPQRDQDAGSARARARLGAHRRRHTPPHAPRAPCEPEQAALAAALEGQRAAGGRQRARPREPAAPRQGDPARGAHQARARRLGRLQGAFSPPCLAPPHRSSTADPLSLSCRTSSRACSTAAPSPSATSAGT